ncbi:unnamed protein product [Laminaria digitata]
MGQDVYEGMNKVKVFVRASLKEHTATLTTYCCCCCCCCCCTSYVLSVCCTSDWCYDRGVAFGSLFFNRSQSLGRVTTLYLCHLILFYYFLVWRYAPPWD